MCARIFCLFDFCFFKSNLNYLSQSYHILEVEFLHGLQLISLSLSILFSLSLCVFHTFCLVLLARACSSSLSCKSRIK